MIWLAERPFLFAVLFLSAGVLSREIGAVFFLGLRGLFFSLAVYSEVLGSL